MHNSADGDVHLGASQNKIQNIRSKYAEILKLCKQDRQQEKSKHKKKVAPKAVFVTKTVLFHQS